VTDKLQTREQMIADVTTSEQQAVQEVDGFKLGMNVRIRDGVRRFGGRIGTVERFHEESISQCPIELRLDDGSAYCFRANEIERLSHPCKSGEGADAGWIVGNNIGQWRTFDSFGWAWTDRRDLAVRYARREDAELCHGEDEDSWRVERFTDGFNAESGDLTKQNQKARDLLWDHVEEAKGLPESGALYSEATVLSAMIAYAALTPDATQTREAELVALADKLCEGRDGTQPGLMGAYRQGVRDLVAALNARGGA